MGTLEKCFAFQHDQPRPSTVFMPRTSKLRLAPAHRAQLQSMVQLAPHFTLAGIGRGLTNPDPAHAYVRSGLGDWNKAVQKKKNLFLIVVVFVIFVLLFITGTLTVTWITLRGIRSASRRHPIFRTGISARNIGPLYIYFGVHLVVSTSANTAIIAAYDISVICHYLMALSIISL